MLPQGRSLEVRPSWVYDRSFTAEVKAWEEEALDEGSFPALTKDTNESTEIATAIRSRTAERIRNLKFARSSRM